MWIYSKKHRQSHPETYFFYSTYRPMKPAYFCVILTSIIFLKYAYLTWSPQLPVIAKLCHTSLLVTYLFFTALVLIGICTTRYDVLVLKITVDLGVCVLLTGMAITSLCFCVFGEGDHPDHFRDLLAYSIELVFFIISEFALLKCHHYQKEYLPTLPGVACFANATYYG